MIHFAIYHVAHIELTPWQKDKQLIEFDYVWLTLENILVDQQSTYDTESYPRDQ